MGFFQFGRKLEAAKEYFLEEIPVFSSLTPSEQRLIEKKVRLIEFKRGDLVYQESTPPDAFYVVISGRFRVFTKSRGNAAGETLLFLYRGDHFGEVSLLTGKYHSASVEAKSDGMILKIEKNDFMRLVKDIPAISLYLNRSLGHRLTKRDDLSGHSREVKIATLYTQGNLDASFQFWVDLAANLSHETSRKVIIVDFVSSTHPFFSEEFKKGAGAGFDLSHMDPSREADLRSSLIEHPSGFHYLHVPVKEEEKEERKIVSLITILTYRYDYLMFRLVQDFGHVTFKALKHSDMVYVYCPSKADQLALCTETLGEFQQSFGFSKSEIKAIVPSSGSESELSFEEMERILGHHIFSILSSKTDQPERYYSQLKFLSRELAGTLIGLALGSGAAYGLAHIGILRGIEKENIPIDVISGSSIGALVGALWAAGYRADELENLARGITKKTAFFKLIGFQDLSIAHRGFFKGNQINRFLESYLGDKTFQDLKIPVKIIAANLFTSEEVILEAGRVVDAIRASISIPGIFRPYYYRGEYLIDGGVIDPLPVRVLARMGVKKIIAVNVLSSAKDRAERNRIIEKKKIQELKSIARESLWKKTLDGLRYRLNEKYSINVFNVIMNTIQFMEYELAQVSGKDADVMMHPEVYDGHWAEFYSPEKFIKAGEEKIKEHLSEIKQLLAE